MRASKLAGKETIPAFIDNSVDSYDQVIENEQRESLRPLDLALFIERRLALNESQTEIARRLGKSQSYVASASALINAPDWLMALYRQGRCQGLTELYLLRRLQALAPYAVMAWLAQQDSVTRASLQGLNLLLAQPQPEPEPEPEISLTPRFAQIHAPTPAPTPSTSASHPTPSSQFVNGPRPLDSKMSYEPSARRLLAHWREQLVEVVTDIAPALPDVVYVKKWPTVDDEMSEVAAAEVKLFGFSNNTAAVKHDKGQKILGSEYLSVWRPAFRLHFVMTRPKLLAADSSHSNRNHPLAGRFFFVRLNHLDGIFAATLVRCCPIAFDF